MDSAQHITNCMKAAIGDVGADNRTDHEIRNIIGLGLEEAVTQLYPDADSRLIHQISAVFREHFLFKDKTPSPLFDGVGNVLEQLRSAGYYLSIATGKSRRGLDKVLRETGFTDFFPVTRCADETFSKPNPQMLFELLTDFNMQAEQAIMVGDSEYDLLMANNAGMDALAVTYGVHGLERLLDHKPVGYVDDVKDIASWLEHV